MVGAMAALPVIANTYRCALNWRTTDGQSAVNVIHIRAASNVATSVINTALGNSVISTMWAATSTAAFVNSVSITPLDGTSSTDEFVTGAPGSPWSGTAAGDIIPAVAAVIKLRTGLRGRSHRGRVFVPAVGEGVQSSGTIAAGTVTSLQAGWNHLIGQLPLQATSCALVVASYKLATAATVTVLTAEAECGTQRRRQGRNRAA